MLFHAAVETVCLLGASYKLAYFTDVFVKTVEGLFLDYTDDRYSHLFELSRTFLWNHGAADDKVGLEGNDFFDVEVADTPDRDNVLRLGRINAEVSASNKKVLCTEGKDYLGDGRRGADDAFRGAGNLDGMLVVVGVGDGGVLVGGGDGVVAGCKQKDCKQED